MLSEWPEWDPCRAKVRGYRDCGRGLPFADVSWSVGVLQERLASVLLHTGRGQCDLGLRSDPLCLLPIWLDQGPNVIVRPRPRGLLNNDKHLNSLLMYSSVIFVVVAVVTGYGWKFTKYLDGMFKGNLTLDKLRNRSRIRINKWYQSFALRNFDLEDMEFETTHSNTTAKLPILKLGEYEMWVIRIKQYFQIQDYALWEVIENGNSWVSVPQTAQENGTSVTKMFVLVTAEEKTNKKNDVKARSLLLIALLNEHQLTFSTLMLKQCLLPLKHDFEVKKYVGASSGAQNLAFMTAPSTSSTNDINTDIPAYEVSIASPNVNTANPQVSTTSFSDNDVYDFMIENPNGSNLLQQDLEQIHEDDLEAIDLKWQLSLLSMRAKRYYQMTGKKIFINANDTARYDKSKVECFNYYKIGHFARECRALRNKEGQFRNQDNTRKQGNNKDTSSKAMLAIDGVGFDWSDMAEEQVQTNMALMVFSDSKVYTDKTCYKTCLKNYETLKKQCDDFIAKLNQTEITAATYKRGLATVEEQLITYRKNEVLFSEEVAVLKREVACKDYEINMLKSEFEKVKQEKEGIEFKIKKFDKASKDLDKLPKKLDLSYSGLDEFKEPEFKGYSPKNKTVFPVDKKVESVKPKNHEKPVNNSVRPFYKQIALSRRSVHTAKRHYYTETPRAGNIARSYTRPVNAVRAKRGKPQQDDIGFVDSECSRHMTGNIAYLLDFNLTCLVAKATLDESMIWHKRLGHINFKNINKLAKDNLVRGLPTKRFENDQTCVACLKRKQHRASCKSKFFNPITKPLFMLHMDLFGLTFDETSEILKNFIKEVENLVDKKVKIIRSDNGTEFKNKIIDDFCSEKGIKREYSVARTPQQNGVAERRNRTLIEATRIMLADSKLPTTFWAEAVSTACYVQNRVLVVKPHNKTPYELFRGFKPALSFMKPFGCHVTILNTLDNLGKFNGKSDEENKPIIEGNGPKWLFDIDSLTQSMNYVPVAAGTIINKSASTQGDLNADTSEEISQYCIVMPIWKDASYFDSLSKDVDNSEPKSAVDYQKQVKDGLDNENDEKDKSDDGTHILLRTASKAKGGWGIFINLRQVKTVNGEVQLQALVDGKKINVTEASVRRDLQLDDEEGMDCLPNATIFEELTRMGSARVVSSNEASLGDQEDASKQGKKINDIDKDAKITSVDETQGSYAATITSVGTYFGSHTDPVKTLKKIDQIKFDEERSFKATAEFDEEESSYFSDENSSIDDLVLDNEYDKLCKMSLKIITKNKRLKATRNSLEKELSILKEKVSTLEKNKGVDLECVKCHMLKIENEKLKEEALKLTKFEKSTHCLNEMLSNQKPSGDKLGLGFNSFEASSSGTKEIKFVKAQKKASSDGGPINMGGPLSMQAAPKAIMGPPPATTPGSEKSVSFQKSILGPRPKHIIVNNVKVLVASDNEVKQFYKPLSKPGVGFSKPNFRSKTPPPRRVINNYYRPKTPQPKRNVGRQNQPRGFPVTWNNFQRQSYMPWEMCLPFPHPNQLHQMQGMFSTNNFGPMRYWGPNV
ncbi:putative ribonuclease H-like domain-containing protein [Tanacetum coccineum]